MTHPHLEGLNVDADRINAFAAIEGCVQWMLHRFGPDSIEAQHARLIHTNASRLSALAALPGGGVEDSPLMPTLAVLRETNPVVRACVDMYRYAPRQGANFSLHSMLALLIAELDLRHDKVQKLALDTLNIRPSTFLSPTPNPPTRPTAMSDFRKELEALINRYSMENGSNTPDFILAEYLASTLETFDRTLAERERWYGRPFVNISTEVTPCPRQGAVAGNKG